MNWRHVKPGDIVYHRLFTQWGPGVVISVSDTDGMEKLFEKGGGPKRIVTKFECHGEPARLFPKVVRKTPNKKKIREMVEFYKSRGTEAIDGGDRLIIPATGL